MPARKPTPYVNPSAPNIGKDYAGANANQIGRGPAQSGAEVGRLGIGIGLGGGARGADRAAFRTAANTGQLDPYLAAHPNQQAKFENAMNKGGARGERARGFAGVNDAAVGAAANGKPGGAGAGAGAQPGAAAPPPGTTPPVGAAANGKAGGGTPAPGATPAATPGATPAAGPPNFSDVMDQQFGAGNPFKMQDWYGGNPLQTATDLSNRNLGKNLADVRAKMAQSGLQAGSDSALLQGAAIGDATTGLGDVMASRGLQARSDDANRAMQGMVNAGQLDIGRQQNALKGMQLATDQGQALTNTQIAERQQNQQIYAQISNWLANQGIGETSGTTWGRIAHGT